MYPSSGTGGPGRRAVGQHAFLQATAFLLFETGLLFRYSGDSSRKKMGFQVEKRAGKLGAQVTVRLGKLEKSVAIERGQGARSSKLCWWFTTKTSTGGVTSENRRASSRNESLCGHPALLMVDAISSLASMEYRQWMSWGSRL